LFVLHCQHPPVSLLSFSDVSFLHYERTSHLGVLTTVKKKQIEDLMKENVSDAALLYAFAD
jgi:hypothetical protein